MTDERPTLTIAVPCPTCGGTGIDNNERNRMIANNIAGSLPPCPDCTDGTINTPVSCAGCKHWTQGTTVEDDADFFGVCQLWNINTRNDFGCMAWTVKENV